MLLQLDEKWIDSRLRGGGGEPFAEFLNRIIRSACRVGGIPDSEIVTNERQNYPDGGIDATVRGEMESDPTGYLSVASAWQYKASVIRDLKCAELRDSLHKDYSKHCIENGYAYRLCVRGVVTGTVRKEWEDRLNEWIKDINPDAPDALVLGSNSIAAWASEYKGLVLSYRPGEFSTLLRPLEKWTKSCRHKTKEYQSLEARADTCRAIEAHIQFRNAPESSVFTIQGQSGVGKTRMVCEILNAQPNAADLVVVMEGEENASRVAYLLANTDGPAILVADDCPVEARVRLKAILDGHQDRIRVIAIDNDARRQTTGERQYWLEKMDHEEASSILKRNFPGLNPGLVLACARLSEGFITLGAELCRHCECRGAASMEVSDLPDSIWDYFNTKLTGDERRGIEALSLVSKIGFRDELKNQIDELSNWLSFEGDLRAIARSISRKQGFVAEGGRYYYVTPEVIAQIGFRYAWEKWAESDVQAFLESLPLSLLSLFMERANRSADKEIRELVSAFFRTQIVEATIEDLKIPDVMKYICNLVETNPSELLPPVKDLLGAASESNLLAIDGPDRGQRSARRHLVWLLERLASFREFFYDVEECLHILARAETEPEIANSATGIWVQLYRRYLSGTETPYRERHSLLRERILESDDDKEWNLVGLALKSTLARMVTRVGGPVMVAGVIPPTDWYPKGRGEREETVSMFVETLGMLEARPTGDPCIAIEALKENIVTLLNEADISQLRILGGQLLHGAEERAWLKWSLEEYLRYGASIWEKRGREGQGRLAAIRAWLHSLEANSDREKIIDIVGKRRLGREEAEQLDKQMPHLAAGLIENQKLFESIEDWLFSEKARSAGRLGWFLGELDKDNRLLDRVLEASRNAGARALAVGYLAGAFKANLGLTSRVNAVLDTYEEEAPEAAFELAMANCETLNGLERSLRLYSEDKLEARRLEAFKYGYGDRELLSTEQLGDILEQLLDGLRGGDASAVGVAIRFLAVYARSDEGMAPLAASERCVQLTTTLLKQSICTEEYHSYDWKEVLVAWLSVDPEVVVDVAAEAIGSSKILLSEEAESVLMQATKLDEARVLRKLRDLISQDGTRTAFLICKFSGLVASISYEGWVKWLSELGEEGAVHIARHLPEPRLDPTGEPYVPELTKYVLTEFEDSDRVFAEFCAGMHSMKMYEGDIAAAHEEEAKIADRFRDHPIRRLREWSVRQSRESREHAKWWKQMWEEEELS